MLRRMHIHSEPALMGSRYISEVVSIEDLEDTEAKNQKSHTLKKYKVV